MSRHTGSRTVFLGAAFSGLRSAVHRSAAQLLARSGTQFDVLTASGHATAVHTDSDT